ncbi:hypothetical protein HY620_02010 [Candidatus Uhrbacteria bacterium]|nr:hypothetical protein [Candidatus Uhrbacteria bacterium]
MNYAPTNPSQGGGFAPRQMFDVTSMNIKCAECGVDVTELPFQPTEKEDGSYGKIFCRDCNRKRRERFSGPRGGGGGGNRFGGQRRQY